MGGHAGWVHPARGPLPNGLLPNEAASVIQALDTDRWMKAEERTAELIACIQPNPPSEDLRNAVADYVQCLIMKCFPCQVFTFGSVPLKTYLPDGDIDLTAFSNNQNLKDTWAHQVRDMLESEEKNENAEFQVKEVQYIQAEVKIIKCLVENIVVDISFNQLGGLCTLCFLEEVDHLIDQNHFFKRSIILIKAWCYYESRILGAHHGLISTYALETLVLYIFHVFNNSFSGPLEVLYRFLEFFSKFDWENFCVSLWGPVPISSLPDVTAEPPRKDGGELLLSKLFLDACSSVYAVFPARQENQGQPFVSKHFNVIDPLRINNNLGRSVSKGNFFRIRSAFAFGAKRLVRLLDCPIEDLCSEVNQFFMNTWERHGSGRRPDVPRNDLWPLELSNEDHMHDSDSSRSNLSRSKISSQCGTLVNNLLQVHSVPSQQGNHPLERTRTADVSSVNRTESQKIYGNSSIPQIYDQTLTKPDANSSQKVDNDKSRSSQPENLISDIHGRYLFVRTHSSPELTDNYAEVSGRLNAGKPQVTSTNIDMSMRKTTESDRTPSNINRSSTGDSSPARQASPHQTVEASAGIVAQLNSYHSDLGLIGGRAEFPSFAGAQGMHQEEQDLANMTASSLAPCFNGQLHVPLNIASGQLPLPITSSVLASMGYASRNLGGFFPGNVPLVEAPWSTTMHFSQPMVSPQFAQCFPSIGIARNAADSTELSFENFHPTGMNPGEREHAFWHEQAEGSTARLDLDNGSFETLRPDNKHHPTSSGVPVSRGSSYGTSTVAEQKFTKETHGSVRDQQNSFQYQDNRNHAYVDERTRNSRHMLASSNASQRSKTSSESSWECPSEKESKSSRDKRGGRNTSGVQATAHTKGKSMSEHSSQTDDDSRELNLQSTVGTEMAESSGCQLMSSLHVSRLENAGFEQGQTNGSVTDSLEPITPVIFGPGSHQKAMDGSGVVPFAFYPTGPPVPFVTMLPLYNFPTETRPDDNLPGHFGGDDCLDHNVSGRNLDTSERLEHSDVFSTSTSTGLASAEQSEQKADILNGDFASHWKNLQYGRYCQNSRHPAPSLYPSPVMVPPVYLQGRLPWEDPGRPVSANSSLFTQLMSSGPHLVPVTPLQPLSNRPTANVFQRYVDEMPRYRVGTGTYLPNPKVSARERHSTSTSTRRANYSYDRNDHHGDREGSWNINSKSRSTPHNHNRIQTEKSSPRSDRFVASENRADRSSHTYGAFSSNQSQSSPIRANPGQSGPSSMAYSLHPLPATSPSGMSSNGPTVPSVVMLYPYDDGTVYRSAEQLEFGSLGPVVVSCVNELSRMSEGARLGAVCDEQRFHSVSAQQASLDQPSSPHLQR